MDVRGSECVQLLWWHSHCGCCSAERPVSSDAQRRKDTSNSENVVAQKDNLTSQHRQQFTGTVAVSVWWMIEQSLCPFPLPPVCFFYRCDYNLLSKKTALYLFSSNTCLQSCNFGKIALKRKKNLFTSSYKRTVGCSSWGKKGFCGDSDEPVMQLLPQTSIQNLFLKKPHFLLVICMFCSWFHVSKQKMVNAGVAMVTVSQQTDLEDANQGQAWLPSVP